jgi:hypothetical protein
VMQYKNFVIQCDDKSGIEATMGSCRLVHLCRLSQIISYNSASSSSPIFTMYLLEERLRSNSGLLLPPERRAVLISCCRRVFDARVNHAQMDVELLPSSSCKCMGLFQTADSIGAWDDALDVVR